jgi:hypothetical protein
MKELKVHVFNTKGKREILYGIGGVSHPTY